jgi:hypothetical protein
MLQLRDRSRRFFDGAALPGLGAWLVFRQQLRGRCPIRDLIWTVVLLLAHLALALALQSAITPLKEYNSDTPRFLLRWLSMAALVGPALYLPCGAVLGAFAVPPISRFEETQSALLTRLTPFDVCAGRLAAALWPVISSLLASCAFWLSVQIAWRSAPGAGSGYLSIFLVHIVLLCAVYMIGAMGFLFALRHRPGRIWGRGALFGTGWAVLCLTTILLINPLIRRMDNPTALINAALTINPATAATTALNMDVLRLRWLYDHTDAPEYPFAYPSPLLSSAIFAGIGLAAQGLSALRLRRAYR